MSEINQPGDQGGMTRRPKRQVQTEWDAPHIDANMSALKRMVDRGWRHFWSKPGRVEPKMDFRDSVQSGFRESGYKKGKAV